VVEFIFIFACLVFVSTITWLSYKLGQTKATNANLAGLFGFILSFIPPLALIYIGFLAFRNDSPSDDSTVSE